MLFPTSAATIPEACRQVAGRARMIEKGTCRYFSRCCNRLSRSLFAQAELQRNFSKL